MREIAHLCSISWYDVVYQHTVSFYISYTSYHIYGVLDTEITALYCLITISYLNGFIRHAKIYTFHFYVP
jgi:hypothetical protein